jgi:inner membrane protein
VAVAALVAIMLLDLALGSLSLPWLGSAQRSTRPAPPLTSARLLEAILDESAHALTGLLLFTAAGLGGGRFPLPILPMLAGAVLIDIDHVPMELGVDVLTRGTNRPYSHSLLTVGVIVVLAGLAGKRFRRAMLALAFGVATHLLRDLATGGVPLFWPWLVRRESIGYGLYLGIMLVSVAWMAWAGRTRSAGHAQRSTM